MAMIEDIDNRIFSALIDAAHYESNAALRKEASTAASHESWMALNVAEGWVYGPEKNMEWIPIAERLPEPSTDVLCFVRFGASIRQTVAGYFPVSQKDDGPHEWLEFAEPEKGLNVTHWMPLPPLPFNAEVSGGTSASTES